MMGSCPWATQWLSVLLLLLLLLLGPGVQAESSSDPQEQTIFQQLCSVLYKAACVLLGEDNVQALLQFFSRLIQGPKKEPEVYLDPVWNLCVDLVGILGLDANDLEHYFRHSEVENNPSGALVVVCAILLIYWFLSLLLGFIFHLLYDLFGPSFWVVRITLFAISCAYILRKYGGEPDQAILRLCLVVAIYFMTCPVGFYCSC